MKLFGKYLKSKTAALLAAFVMALVFWAAFLLFRLPIEPLIYPTVVCALMVAVFLAVDFARTRRKYENIRLVMNNVAEAVSGLPSADTLNEEALGELVEEMQRLVGEQEMKARAKYNDMTDYYTVWAHQIKTPISGMKLILQNEDSDTARLLSAELFKIQQYVDMVLAFLRLDSESHDFVLKEYEISDIVKTSVRKFATEFIGRKLSFTMDDFEIRAVTDEKWLGFVIEQIISNSLKYTREGGIRISAEDDVLVISDTGIGIAAEDLPRIFEKGYTGYNGRTDKEATGLGLYLCKQVCEKLGHEIRIESQAGEGTRISISLKQTRRVRE